MTGAATPAEPAAESGPWNPGLQSRIPDRLVPLCSFMRADNVFTSVTAARELHDLTGLALADLVAFRPHRLALHELMIRISADISVPDGVRVEDLGINFRNVVRMVLAEVIAPQNDAIVAIYDAARQRIAQAIDEELRLALAGAAATTDEAPAPSSRLLRFLGAAARRAPAQAPAIVDESAAVARWEARARDSGDPAQRAALRALAQVAAALYVRHGSLWGGRDLIARIACDLACNDFGSDEIGRVITPWVYQAAEAHGHRVLPKQEQPVVMNTKGASAAGKSTIRPLQRRLAADIGVDWSEFALISPDIWRKQLLDYASLGADYKYGAALSGEEVRIIDLKLDRYMARKAERGEMTHLLIDRFRFDSFAPDSQEAGSNLLTRFGQIVYLFFVVTPPASLVERAWKRGLEVGRYKAVDDTLAHAVEAYSGMPELFFTWIDRADKRVHFEFLDNTVPFGERPRTIAFGTNDTLNVLDVECMLDVERYRRINIDARSPAELYPDRAMLAPEQNLGFVRQCATRFASTCFAEQGSGRIFLELQKGVPVGCDRELLQRAAAIPDVLAALRAVAPNAFTDRVPAFGHARSLHELPADRSTHTLGRWG